jgi:hypothetical protein
MSASPPPLIAPTVGRTRTMKPILELEFHHDGRGPELKRVIWSSSVPRGFEYFNPTDSYVAENLKHLRLVKVEAFAFAGEEVHGNIVTTAGTNAAIHNLGRTPWLQTFNPRHLDDCSHYQIMFYDEIFDVICQDIHADVGPFTGHAPPNKPMQSDRPSAGR